MYRRIIVALVALIFVPMIVVAQPSSRLVRNLNEGWRFFYSWDSEAQEAEYVSLPHCWDSVLGASSYYSSTANYTRNVTIPAEWSERRLFMRFGGVNSVADLFVNGRYVGTHKGGYTSFTMEITQFVRFGADNFIRVVVSNSERNDMLPVSTDVDITAGIYRDVELVVTPKSIISPLYHSSEGVFVVQNKVSEDGVEGVVQCHLSAPTAEQVQLTMRIVGPDGYEVDHRTMRVSKLSDGKVVEIPFEIGHPELWSPASPSMYRVEVVVDDGKAGGFVIGLSRTVGGKTYVSTQNIVVTNNDAMIAAYSSQAALQRAIDSYGESEEAFLSSTAANELPVAPVPNSIISVKVDNITYTPGVRYPNLPNFATKQLQIFFTSNLSGAEPSVKVSFISGGRIITDTTTGTLAGNVLTVANLESDFDDSVGKTLYSVVATVGGIDYTAQYGINNDDTIEGLE